MTQPPRSRAGLACSITAAGLGVVAYPIAFALGSADALWAFLALTLIVGIIALGVTAIELLAGYRGSSQTLALVVAFLACSAPVLFGAWIALGGAGS
jgi:hypothetical protein